MRISSFAILFTAVFSFCGQGEDGFDPSLLLLGSSVGVSPSNAADGQSAASPGQASGSDLENPSNPSTPPSSSNPVSGNPSNPASPSNPSNPATPSNPPAQNPPPTQAPSSPAEDSTPPRLLRVEWAADCKTMPNGYTSCDSKSSGPEFIFDEPIDCNSAPQLSGKTIVNGGTIKAYHREAFDYVPGFVSGKKVYSMTEKDQSVAIQSFCNGNRVRVVPVIDQNKFRAGPWTVILVGGIKDLAGNVTPDGDTRFAGPIGDMRDQSELGQLFDLNSSDHPPASYTSPLAVLGNPGQSSGLYDFFVMPYIDQKITSNGKIIIMQPSFPLNCDNTTEMKKYFSVETVLFDDFYQGKPFKPFAITQTSCFVPVAGANPAVVIDPPVPEGSFVRLRVDGTLQNTAATMTMGSGKYIELLQEISGQLQPIPRASFNLLYRWPPNLGIVPECQNLEVEQTITHFDTHGSNQSCGAVKFSDMPTTSTATHYFYFNQSLRSIASGVCVDYTGPKYDAEYPEGMTDVCANQFPGPGVPNSLRPTNDFPFYSSPSCQFVLPILPGGKSYIDTGVVGICIEKPGQYDEYALYYFTYEQKAAARAACKGVWRESGFNYGQRWNLSSETPGTVKKVTTLVCPTADTNAGGATTKPPTGQTCDGRTVEIDTTGGRWFTTPEKTIPIPDKPGKVTKVKGIHTYWQDEPLAVRVKKNCQAGYYKLTFKGMNVDGPLPDFYKGYALTVSKNGQEAGAVVLSASDVIYGSVSLNVYLEEGDTTLDVRWKNDAYKQGVYDANLHLNGVTMAFVPNYVPPTKLAKTAREFCDIEGRFFFGTKSAWTPSANQQISYCYPSLPSGKYEVTVTGKNHGTLPQGYAAFQLNVSGDGVNGTISIPAASDVSKSGKVVLDITQGSKQLDIKWTNDVYITDDVDTAFEMETIKLKRIGDSERSQLAAFMLQQSRSRSVLLIAIAMLLVSAAGIVGLKILRRNT